MQQPERQRRSRRRWWIAIAAIAVALFLRIDDWRRDFIESSAEISPLSLDESLLPLESHRSADDLVEAVRWAARRIRNWEYVGQSRDGDVTRILFVRTHRLLRTRDDVTLRVEDLGDRRRITGESVSRLGIGDLGGNPRNLRRVLYELRDVLEGAGP